MSAKAQRIGNRDVQIGLDGRVGCVVEVALRVGVVQADGGRNDAVVQRHHADDQLDGTSSTQGVTHLRLGGADVGLVGFFLTHGNLDGAGLAAVVHGRTCAVGVDVEAFTGLEVGFVQCLLDGERLGGAIGTRCRAVVSIAAVAIAAELGVDLRAALLGMFVLFEEDDARAFGDDEALTGASLKAVS